MRHRPSTPYWFLLPALAVFVLFVLVPIAESARLSVFCWPSPASPPEFCGLRNFVALAGDPVFRSAVAHNVLLVIVSLAVQLPCALFLAVLLDRSGRFTGVLRTAFFAPMVMPTTAIAVLWVTVYMPQDGLLDRLLALFGATDGHGWLSDPNTVLPAVFATICWRYVGFHMVLFLAGLAAIPTRHAEAARLDGASEWQVFRHVTLPLLRPTVAVSATLSVVGSLKYFDLVYMMAGGAPEKSREVLATYCYRLAFEGGQARFGYASAAATVLLVGALAVGGSLSWLRRERAEGGRDGP